MTSKKKKVEVTNIRPAGDEHQVVSIKSSDKRYRRKPCEGCPWVVENAGDFPAEAFRHSAETSQDMSEHTFACHESGSERPSTCAGFLLRGADNNMAIRLRIARGEIDYEQIKEDGRDLFDSYREMAIGNGVPPDDPALKQCRP